MALILCALSTSGAVESHLFEFKTEYSLSSSGWVPDTRCASNRHLDPSDSHEGSCIAVTDRTS